MAQSGCSAEISQCLSSDLHSFGTSHPVKHLISQIHSMEPVEQLSLHTNSLQDSGGLEESGSDSLNQFQECSPSVDPASAFRSAALMLTLKLKDLSPVLKLVSVLQQEEETRPLSPLDDTEGAADAAEEEEPSVFQSKYIHFFPLYQDYCLEVLRGDLHRPNKALVSELVTPQHVQALASRPGPRWHSEATSPPPNPPEATASPARPVPRVTPCTLWRDLDEVKASGLLSTLRTRELRLQESLFELIGSEASYLRSLGVAVNHFYTSKELKRTLSPMQHHVLFSNIHRVMAASEKFLMDLELRLAEGVLISQVGDIVLQHCPAFHKLYVPYVTNMMYQEALLNQLLQQNRNFLYSLKKLESEPACQRQSLKSFLILPFQRITRIKLILASILKLTEPASGVTANLEDAIEAIHEIVTRCDEEVRRMKQIEELVCLEMLLDFGKVKSLPLVVSGRFLVHQGPVRQLAVEADSRVSFIDVYLHLFSDLLILSSQKDQRFTVADHARFPAHVHLRQLKTEVLGLPPDSFLVHLSESQTGQPTAMIFVTHTRSDKDTWMKVLSSPR